MNHFSIRSFGTQQFLVHSTDLGTQLRWLYHDMDSTAKGQKLKKREAKLAST